MEGSYDKHLLKLMSRHYRDVALVGLDVAYSVKESAEELARIRKLLVDEREKHDKLMKLGLTCLALPEPIVSNVIGGMLLTVGYFMSRGTRDGSLRDMVEAVKELRRLLESHHI